MSSPGSSLPDGLIIGLKVRTNAGVGIIRFIGDTKFANGVWVGVELDEPTGKNDGQVMGVRYFTTKVNHGLFIRPSFVKPLSDPSILSPNNFQSTNKQEPSSPTISNLSFSTKLTNESQSNLSATALPVSNILPVSAGNSPNSIPAFDHNHDIFLKKTLETPSSSPMSQTPDNVSPSSFPSEKAFSLSTKTDYIQEETERHRLQTESLLELKTSLHQITSSMEKSNTNIAKELSPSHVDKLLEKIQSLQQETRELRKELLLLRESKDDIEVKYTEAMDALELVTLDKEMAEEKLETMQSEIENLNEKLLRFTQEEIRNEQLLDNDQTASERNWQEESQYLRKQNERFKDALLRLKDAKDEVEHELTHRIRILETELTHAANNKEQLTIARDRISMLEANIEELRNKLEDALGLEDLLEQLTDDNLRHKEKLEVMEQHIQDLESLKELNEALEHSHLEVQKDLQQEVELKNAHVENLESTLEEHQNSIKRYEFTMQQLRSKVTTLQEQLKLAEEEKKTFAPHSGVDMEAEREVKSPILDPKQTLLHWNSKFQQQKLQLRSLSLQSSLHHLSAQQAQEQLNFWMSYLPPSIIDQELPAIHSILLLKRLIFKIDLISPLFNSASLLEANISFLKFSHQLQWIKHCLQPMLLQVCQCEESEFLTQASSLPPLFPIDKELDDLVAGLCLEENIGAREEEEEEQAEMSKLAAKISPIFQRLTEPLDDYANRMQPVSGQVAQSLHARSWLKLIHYAETNASYASCVFRTMSCKLEKDSSNQPLDQHFHSVFNGEGSHFWVQLNTEATKAYKSITAYVKDPTPFLGFPQSFSCSSPVLEHLNSWSLFFEQFHLRLHTHDLPSHTSRASYFQSNSLDLFRLYFSEFLTSEENIGESCIALQLRFKEILNEIQTAHTLLYQCLSISHVSSSTPVGTSAWVSRGKKFQLSEKTKDTLLEEKWKDLHSQLHQAALDLKEKEAAIEQLRLKCQFMEARLPSQLEEQKLSSASQLHALSNQLQQCLTELSNQQRLVQQLQQENQHLTSSKQAQESGGGQELNYLRQALHLLRNENACLRAKPWLEKLRIFHGHPLFNSHDAHKSPSSFYHQAWQTLSRRARELAASPRLAPVVRGWHLRSTTPFQRHLVHLRMLQHKVDLFEDQLHQALTSQRGGGETSSDKPTQLIARIKLPRLSSMGVLERPVQCHVSTPNEFQKIHEMLLCINQR